MTSAALLIVYMPQSTTCDKGIAWSYGDWPLYETAVGGRAHDAGNAEGQRICVHKTFFVNVDGVVREVR